MKKEIRNDCPNCYKSDAIIVKENGEWKCKSCGKVIGYEEKKD